MKALLVVACAGLFACSVSTETEERAPSKPLSGVGSPNTPTDDGAGDTARLQDPRISVGGIADMRAEPFVCREGAVCEDFEQVDLDARWFEAFKDNGGTLERGAYSASSGRGALELFTQDARSSAYLFHADDHGVGNQWAGMMGFAFRVNQAPVDQLSGPELTVKTPDGLVAIRVSLRREGLVLEQLAPDTCARERCQPKTTLLAPAKASDWYHVSVGFEANDQATAPYGRIETYVDGQVIGTDLTVPLFNGSATFRAGITQGDSDRALASLDDVTLQFR